MAESDVSNVVEGHCHPTVRTRDLSLRIDGGGGSSEQIALVDPPPHAAENC